MKIPIGKDWSFIKTVNAVNQTYMRGGLIAGQRCLGIMRSWGCIVGKKKALIGLEEAINENGAKKIADKIGLSVASLKTLRQFYESLPEPERITLSPYEKPMLLNKMITLEEDRFHEFKEIKGKNPFGAIQNTADEYVVAYLNSEGGSIFWGIRNNDRVVCGVYLTYEDRDKLRQNISNKLVSIQPAIDPTAFKVHFHQIIDEEGNSIENLTVLEIVVPRIDSNTLYFTAGNEAFVRIDGIKKKLSGPEIQDWIVRRMSR